MESIIMLKTGAGPSVRSGFVAKPGARAGTKAERNVKIDTGTEAGTGAGVYFMVAAGTKA